MTNVIILKNNEHVDVVSDKNDCNIWLIDTNHLDNQNVKKIYFNNGVAYNANITKEGNVDKKLVQYILKQISDKSLKQDDLGISCEQMSIVFPVSDKKVDPPSS